MQSQTTQLYEDLDEEDLMRLACKHLTRGQEIPHELMTVLEGLGIAENFKNVPSETDEDAAD